MKAREQRSLPILRTCIGRDRYCREAALTATWSRRSHSAYELETVHLRHADVAEEHIEAFARERLQRFFGAIHAHRSSASAFENPRDQRSAVRLVIHDEHANFVQSRKLDRLERGSETSAAQLAVAALVGRARGIWAG